MRLTIYDSLTGLPKLNLFKNKIIDLINQITGKQNTGIDKFAIVYIDIDNFRYLKETFGSIASDEVIKCVADYLVGMTKNSYFVARTARDKFAIIFTKLKSNMELLETIEEIINNISNTSSTNNVFSISMSAGIAFYPDHGSDNNSLIQNAETALYSAKTAGKDVKIYSDKLQRDITGHLQMVNRLQTGLEKEEFTLFYQPEYNLDTNEIIGVEALVRWFHPINGYISPELFIPIAEKSKQIYALERWIINTALQQKMQWESDGLGHIELSINLSSKTLESESNFQKIVKIFSSYKVNYSKIIIEVTETIIITNVDLAMERLNRLRKLGVKIALDDFGTGYSSLTHLMKLPIDIIKIDRSFIKSIPYGSEETAITKNILSMAHDLNFRVVAEGIETMEQLEYLKTISCERGQGFLLCIPLPSEKVDEVLREKNLKYIICNSGISQNL